MRHPARHRPGPAPAIRGLRHAVAALGLGVAGCGGGLYLGFERDVDFEPEVALASAVSEAAVGQSVQLAAAASDDYGIDEVRLYEVAEDGTLLRLADDRSAPYQWTVILPASASGRVRYLARAFDDAGQTSESNLVEIMLR